MASNVFRFELDPRVDALAAAINSAVAGGKEREAMIALDGMEPADLLEMTDGPLFRVQLTDSGERVLSRLLALV